MNGKLLLKCSRLRSEGRTTGRPLAALPLAAMVEVDKPD
jgi:hypothetical protein